MLTLVERHPRPRRRIGVGVEVENFLTVETVIFDRLPDEAQGDGDIVGRFEPERDAGAETGAAVDVFLTASARTKRIDEAAELGELADDAQCRAFADGQVDHAA